MDTGAAVLVADQVEERGVELDGADRPAGDEVVVGAGDGGLAHGQTVFVHQQPAARREHEARGVDRRRADREVRVEADAERGRVALRLVAVAEAVRPSSPRRYSTPSSSRQGNRAPGTTAHDSATASSLLVPRLPRAPTHETVDGVRPLGLVEGGLEVTALERVAPVAQAVRPRRQYLAPTAAGPVVDGEAVDDRDRRSPSYSRRVAPISVIDSTLVPVADLELAT